MRMCNYAYFEVFYMRSALFLHDNENLMNRIKIMLHDDNAEYYFSSSIDEALSLLDSKEIAVVFMPYNFDVMNGNEMIEIVLDHNPKAQIIVLFKDSDLSSVVKSHNNYHLCQIISDDFFKIEDLPSMIETAFGVYNRDDEIKSFELDYRRKEDKYKKTLTDMTGLLNDRIIGYEFVRDTMTNSCKYLCDNLPQQINEKLSAFFDSVTEEYIKLFMINSGNLTEILTSIINDCNDSDIGRFFKSESDSNTYLNENIVFNTYLITRFVMIFYTKYRGKAEYSEQDTYYSLNYVFEALPSKEVSKKTDILIKILIRLLENNSDKVIFGTKERIIQFRIMYKKQ